MEKEIFNQFEKGNIPGKNSQRYFAEIQRLYEKRQAAMDPARDARLSFTTSMEYLPGGVPLPAWKDIFFNPKTDRAVLDDLVRSIEEL
jgi:L-2,4-diaminobutyrate decarboxylase